MNVLTQFGVDWPHLIIQIINFAIILIVLKIFLYKPMLKVLQERKDRIAKSMQDAEEIQKQLQASEAEREKKLQKAIAEAQEIINEAKQSASEIIQEAHSKAEEDIKTMIARSETSLKVEQERLHQEMRSELANLVVSAMKKVAPHVLTKEDQERIIQESTKGAKGL